MPLGLPGGILDASEAAQQSNSWPLQNVQPKKLHEAPGGPKWTQAALGNLLAASEGRSQPGAFGSFWDPSGAFGGLLEASGGAFGCLREHPRCLWVPLGPPDASGAV